MSGSRTSSLSKTQKLSKPIKPVDSLQPMTELYLRQFFKNQSIKIDRKQKQTMFTNSIEVLNFLIEEYEQKFAIENDCEQPKFTLRQGKQFQGFYNRLKNIFQLLYEKFESSETPLENCKNNQNTHKDTDYQDYLFPENSSFQTKKISSKPSPETDEDLYQLVTDLKKQNEESELKIKTLEKQLKEKEKLFQSLEKKFNVSIEELKKRQKENQDLTESLGKIVEQKAQNQQKYSRAQGQIKELRHNLQKNEVLIMLKNEQIKRLEVVEATLSQASKEKAELKQKLREASQKYEKNVNDNQILEMRNKEAQNAIKVLKQENLKLRKIISQKLSAIGVSQDKQNHDSNSMITLKSTQSYDYLKEVFTSMMKNEKLLNANIEKEVKRFIQNLIEKDKTMAKKPSLT